VRLLADTHALLWLLDDDPQLSDRARDLLLDPGNEALLSAVAIWEVTLKRALGKLEADEAFAAVLLDADFDELPITIAHAERAGTLEPHHRDPFDRLLIAQAQVEGATVVTADPAFADYDVATAW
jgi:PIN domain nuclease of toxin-antitoxin system